MGTHSQPARRRRNRLLPLAVAVAFTLAVALESSNAGWPDLSGVTGRASSTAERDGASSAARRSGGVDKRKLMTTAAKALGQMVVTRFSGTEPPAELLRRARRGEIGGVILFADNTSAGEDAVAGAIGRLQRAARAGNNPPLLVMVDQEGGEIRRLPGPPKAAPRDFGSDEQSYEQGHATGEYLRALGIAVNLAPVADVARGSTFLGSRAFGSSPTAVAARACAFATGLRDSGVAATLKHFPGLGRAAINTDEGPTTVDQPADALRADYAPYESCAAEPLTLVMISSARYPSLGADVPAVMSTAIHRREARLAGIEAVTISDDLEAPAIASETTPARRAIEAGLDLLLYARSEATSAYAYSRLLADVEEGRLKAEPVRRAARRILKLKAALAR